MDEREMIAIYLFIGWSERLKDMKEQQQQQHTQTYQKQYRKKIEKHMNSLNELKYILHSMENIGISLNLLHMGSFRTSPYMIKFTGGLCICACLFLIYINIYVNIRSCVCYSF